MSSPLRHDPQQFFCPQCKQTVQTVVEHKSTQKTHLWALLLCVLGCWCCAPMVYCTGCARDAEHYCPQCRTYLGACHV